MGVMAVRDDVIMQILGCRSLDQLVERILKPVAARLGARSAVFAQLMELPRFDGCIAHTACVGIDATSVAQYAGGRFRDDPLLDVTRQSSADRRRALPAKVVHLASGRPRSSAFCADFLEPLGITDVLGVVLPTNAPEPQTLCLGFHRYGASPAFEPADVRTLGGLVPLLEPVLRALFLSQSSSHLAGMLAAFLEADPLTGIAVLDGDLALEHANEQAWLHLGRGGRGLAEGLGDLKSRIRKEAADCRGPMDLTFSLPEPRRGAAISINVRSRTAPDGRTWYLVRSSNAPIRAPAERRSLRGMTPRECDVLALLARGNSNAAIADGLRISRRTVENHLRAMYRKAGVNSRTQLLSAFLGQYLPAP